MTPEENRLIDIILAEARRADAEASKRGDPAARRGDRPRRRVVRPSGPRTRVMAIRGAARG